MCDMAMLVVGMARQPPARVNSFLDQRLDSASTVQEVLTAAVAHGVQRLKDCCRSSDADCAGAMRYVSQERERMKAGLAVYNAELTKLRQYLEEHYRGKGCSSSPRMKALLAENASLRRANSVLRQNSAEHRLNTDTLILSTAGLSASGLDCELLGLGPDHTGLLWLMPPSSQSQGSVDEDSEHPVTEVSESPSKASLGSGSLSEGSVEHSFIRSSSDSSVEPSTEVSVSGSDSGGLFDDEPNENPPRKRKRLRQNAVVRSAPSSPSKLPAVRRLGRPSVDLKRKAASTAILSVDRSDHKKARPNGRPRRSTSVISELRMRENLERELADDDFMLGLTNEGLVAPTSSPPQGTVQAVVTHAGVAELPTEESVATEPPTANSSVEAQVPPESSSAETPGGAAAESMTPTISTPSRPIQDSPPSPPRQPSAVPISQLLNEVDVNVAALGGSDASVKGSEVDNESSAELSSAGLGFEGSVEPSTLPVQPVVQPQQATEDSVRSSSRTRRGRGHVIKNDPRPRRPTRVITATVTARRGTDNSTFTPAVAAISRATNSRKLPANTERFLKPGFTVVGAQKAWCKMLNVSLSAAAPKEHSPPLDFAFLALMYNDNEKVDLCVALWERRHWLQVSSMDNAIQAFRKASDPRDPFTRVVLSLWADLNRTRNNRADLLRQQFDRLWDWCSKTNGGSGNLPTEVLLEPSYLQYSMEVLEWAPVTEDRSRELRVLDAEQPWRNSWIDAPVEHPYNTTYAPCNPSVPLFVATSMTGQAVLSGIVVDQSLADADLVPHGLMKSLSFPRRPEVYPRGSSTRARLMLRLLHQLLLSRQRL
ncbi:hypothetical protein PHMEG_00025261 [Phytophthora megakarya]|uniref:Uncharacterized protein n=1 Tax=Phytophthora megakarya TaxID=4795 RepID=A0A225VCG7_9STRA|nr:hypothetical protein PHMEG_00025261 [Phytophthora megakarya]